MIRSDPVRVGAAALEHPLIDLPRRVHGSRSSLRETGMTVEGICRR
jgi:hypothetical protein